MWAAGGLSRQVPADAAASQFCKASATALPLFPGDGAQPPPDPLIKPAQHRRCLTEAEVTAPTDQIARVFFGNLLEASNRFATRSAERASRTMRPGETPTPNRKIETGLVLDWDSLAAINPNRETWWPKYRDRWHNPEQRLGKRKQRQVGMERRRFPRGKSFHGGVIAFNGRRSTIDCVVRNYGCAGAKIAMSGTALLPDSFDLNIARKESSFRAHLVWRNDCEAGVEFATDGRPDVISLDVARKLQKRQAEIRRLRERLLELADGY
jgi:hypothetical protein